MSTNFSIIIPTLWKSDRIYKLLDDLQDCHSVNEIILIDNSNEYFDRIDKIIPKVRVVSTKENMYVNPSWNLGVSLARNSNLAILNDDINFNTDIFEFIKDHMDKGIIGQCCSNYDPIDRGLPYEIEKPTFRPSGWGCMLFIKKENYITIPMELLIACGDDFLFDRVKGGGYNIKNLRVDTKISTTSLLSQFSQIQDDDIKNYKKIKND
jgi:hypothetical protein